MPNFGMGYYDGSDDADEFEQDEYEPPQRQQREAPRSPGLRAHMKAISRENRELKQELEQQKAMLQELMADDTPQGAGLPATGHAQNRLTPEEQMQYARLAEMGVIGTAAPAGVQADQIRSIEACKSPDELRAYLAGQGNAMGTASYNGIGFSY